MIQSWLRQSTVADLFHLNGTQKGNYQHDACGSHTKTSDEPKLCSLPWISKHRNALASESLTLSLISNFCSDMHRMCCRNPCLHWQLHCRFNSATTSLMHFEWAPGFSAKRKSTQGRPFNHSNARRSSFFPIPNAANGPCRASAKTFGNASKNSLSGNAEPLMQALEAVRSF